MGDIAEQTLAGATSTGTHGTGGVAAGSPPRSPASSWSPAPARCSGRRADENPDVLDVARVGLGALGVLTTITFRVEPLFVLEAHEQPMTWDEALDVVRRAGRGSTTTSTCTGSRTPTG